MIDARIDMTIGANMRPHKIYANNYPDPKYLCGDLKCIVEKWILVGARIRQEVPAVCVLTDEFCAAFAKGPNKQVLDDIGPHLDRVAVKDIAPLFHGMILILMRELHRSGGGKMATRQNSQANTDGPGDNDRTIVWGTSLF